MLHMQHVVENIDLWLDRVWLIIARRQPRYVARNRKSFVAEVD